MLSAVLSPRQRCLIQEWVLIKPVPISDLEKKGLSCFSQLISQHQISQNPEAPLLFEL